MSDLAMIDCRCGRRHQPRERLVPCSGCGRPTEDVHAVCPACVSPAELAVAAGGDGDRGVLPGPPGPRSAGFVFEVAAVLRGHNLATEEGCEAARHDFRLWDLYERMLP